MPRVCTMLNAKCTNTHTHRCFYSLPCSRQSHGESDWGCMQLSAWEEQLIEMQSCLNSAPLFQAWPFLPTPLPPSLSCDWFSSINRQRDKGGRGARACVWCGGMGGRGWMQHHFWLAGEGIFLFVQVCRLYVVFVPWLSRNGQYMAADPPHPPPKGDSTLYTSIKRSHNTFTPW